MITSLTDITINHVLVGIGALVTIWGLYRSVLRAIKKALGDLPVMLRDWSGEPERPGVPRRPGVMERLGHIEQKLNESTSLDARVTKLENELPKLGQDIATIKTVLLIQDTPATRKKTNESN